jgi:endonuclease YncB( thermonuclease family)
MKTLAIAAIAVFLSSTTLAQTVHQWKVIKVTDGDTIQVEAPWVPDPIAKKVSIRVLGIDTPEKGGRAQCEKEAELGEKATAFARAAIKPGDTIGVVLEKWDKFGGRVLGYVKYDGKDLSEEMLKAGLARPYFGEKKSSWCD